MQPPERTPQKPSPVSVVDGQVRIEVGADLVVDEDTAQGLYDQIYSIVEQAVADGLAAGMGALLGAAGESDSGDDRPASEPAVAP